MDLRLERVFANLGKPERVALICKKRRPTTPRARLYLSGIAGQLAVSGFKVQVNSYPGDATPIYGFAVIRQLRKILTSQNRTSRDLSPLFPLRPTQSLKNTARIS